MTSTPNKPSLLTTVGMARRGQCKPPLRDGADEAAHAPTPADLAATASQLESVIADGEPEQAKALLRILIAELRVNGRHDIQPTYRVIAPDRTHTAEVCATSGKVDASGPRLNRRARVEALRRALAGGHR